VSSSPVACPSSVCCELLKSARYNVPSVKKRPQRRHRIRSPHDRAEPQPHKQTQQRSSLTHAKREHHKQEEGRNQRKRTALPPPNPNTAAILPAHRHSNRNADEPSLHRHHASASRVGPAAQRAAGCAGVGVFSHVSASHSIWQLGKAVGEGCVAVNSVCLSEAELRF
jgi:hypothetical protein